MKHAENAEKTGTTQSNSAEFVSFNINGIRAHLHQLDTVIRRLSSDILGLQETKVRDCLFPAQRLSAYGYEMFFHGSKQHNGVALFSRTKPLGIVVGDAEHSIFRGRPVAAEFVVRSVHLIVSADTAHREKIGIVRRNSSTNEGFSTRCRRTSNDVSFNVPGWC